MLGTDGTSEVLGLEAVVKKILPLLAVFLADHERSN
jgi:hypothetical protein